MSVDIYDIDTEMTRPVVTSDATMLNQLTWAYGRLREARKQAPHRGLLWLEAEMDRIHAELQKRLGA
jgi:hypothetical protein